MSEKSLRELTDDIGRALEQGEATDAIQQARRLLCALPRYVMGYQLLAQAALDAGHPDDAIRLFRRVLSADPESAAAYSGIAAAQQRLGQMDDALWHADRSFELRPDDPAARQQLRSLREAAHGRAPGRLRLGPVASARAELSRGNYRHATRNLESLLADDPARADLRLALAEAAWRRGRWRVALFHAESVLDELPHSLKANLVAGQYHQMQGDTAGAAPYLDAAHELDPDHGVARELFGRLSALSPQTTTLLADELRDEPLPEWLADLALFAAGDGPPDGPDGGSWRDALARSTRAALDPRPDWRAALRRATDRAMPARGSPWRQGLRRATGEALDGGQMVALLAPVWQTELRAATADGLAQYRERESVGNRPWLFDFSASRGMGWAEQFAGEDDDEPLFEWSLEPPRNAHTGLQTVEPLSWDEALAAEMALLEPGEGEELTLLVDDSTGMADADPNAEPTWRDLLRINTELALTLRDESLPAAPVTSHPWVDGLRHGTGLALNGHRPHDGAATLAAADRRWAQGDARGALHLYHDLYLSQAVPVQQLAYALETWIGADRAAPSLAYHLLGDFYLALGRRDDARDCFRQAVEHL